MPRLPFIQIDVFTSKAFGGNPLAVFLDAQGLTADQMQILTREMNYSECTFLLPPERPGSAARVRIFAPSGEMPMAGHPTIGTALVLLNQGRLTGNQATLDLKIGPMQIDFDASFVWMTQTNPQFSPAYSNRDEVAAALGLTPQDLHPTLPIQTVSTSVPYLLIPLNNLDTLARATFHQQALASLVPHCSYLFTPTFAGLRARMFNPLPHEMPEDPATGSAAGPLAAYAVEHGLQPEGEFLIEQGVEMGRPSQIHARVHRTNGKIEKLQIGGTGVILGHGEIYWDSSNTM